MNKLFIIPAVLFFALNSAAQSSQDDLQNKFRQTEVQLQKLQSELEKLKKATEPPVQVAKAETSKIGAKDDAKLEKNVEPDKRPIGIELANGVRRIPYGTLFFNEPSHTASGYVPEFPPRTRD